jgi:hypothetical protein
VKALLLRAERLYLAEHARVVGHILNSVPFSSLELPSIGLMVVVMVAPPSDSVSSLLEPAALNPVPFRIDGGQGNDAAPLIFFSPYSP